MTTDTTLVIERHLAAHPEQVYEAWTNPEILVKWWGPEGVTIPSLNIDVREGGKWTTTMHSDKMGNHTVCGQYITLDPPNRLVFTWAWITNDGLRGHQTQVEIRLEKSRAGTKMTLTQSVFENAEQCNNHKFGWDSSFNKLDETVVDKCLPQSPTDRPAYGGREH